MTVRIDTMTGWVRLTLDRPEARNTLNTAMLAALAGALEACAVDPACRAVVIRGEGGTFAAGSDIAEIEHKGAAHWAAIRAFPKPLIAAVDGFALGGGFELALMADLLVLGAGARVGLPETGLGLVPGAGGGQRLLALVGPARAARLVLTGEIIDAPTAFAWGIGAYLAEGSASDDAEALATRIASRAPLALAAAKAALVEGAERGLAFSEERAGFEALLDSADKAEGIRAFRAKRPPEFRGT
jgi:enoyl-CoA hydratase